MYCKLQSWFSSEAAKNIHTSGMFGSLQVQPFDVMCVKQHAALLLLLLCVN